VVDTLLGEFTEFTIILPRVAPGAEPKRAEKEAAE